MNSQYALKKPKPLKRQSSSNPFIPSSSTPTLKLSSQTAFRSDPITQVAQSHANSPVKFLKDSRSLQPSPYPKNGLELNGLIKKSLETFKSQKLELEKIKEVAKDWEEARRKKLREYNLQTRTENHKKFKGKAFRPRTAWGSPELKDFFQESRQNIKKNLASSAERRANIGLEFYNLKSDRNCTPKALKERKTTKVKKIKGKKEIELFMIKKRKERNKIKAIQREKEEEEEFKRMSQLMKVDRAAKNVMKRAKRRKLTKKKGKVNKLRNGANKKNICFSEDEEVLNIMQVRTLGNLDEGARGGRECAIFGNISNQFSDDNINATEIANQIVGKRTKPERHSAIVSISMPIIELKSITSESSLDKPVFNEDFKINEVKEKVNKLKASYDSQKSERFALASKKLASIANRRNSSILIILISAKALNPQKKAGPASKTAEFKLENLNPIERQSGFRIEEIQVILNRVTERENRKSAEDLEKPIKTPEVIEIHSSLNTSPQKPSNDFSASMVEHLKKIQLPSAEFTSLAVDQLEADLDEFPSLPSIAHSSIELPSDLPLFSKNSAQPSIRSDPLPSQPYFAPPLILIDDANSVSNNSGHSIVFDSLAIPEAEEIADISSIQFEAYPQQIMFSNNTGLSESTLALSPEDLTSACIKGLINWLVTEYLNEAINKHHTLTENAVVVLHDVHVRTGVSAILNFLEKLWDCATKDIDTFVRSFNSSFHHNIKLSLLQNTPNITLKPLLSTSVLAAAEKTKDSSFSLNLTENSSKASKIHNALVFDFMNSDLARIKDRLVPPPWRVGEVPIDLQAEEVLQEIMINIRKCCMIGAGRVPSAAMIGERGELDEDLLQKIRENGLAAMLAADIEADETSWVDYELDEIGLILEISDEICEKIIEEVQEIVEN